MGELAEKLMSVNFDSNYTTSEVKSLLGAKQHFFRHLEELLRIVCIETRANRGFISLTGFETGHFTPVAFFNQASTSVSHMPTSGPGSKLFRNSQDVPIRKVIVTNGSFQKTSTTTQVAEHAIFPIEAHGETLGFCCIERDSPFFFDENAITCLNESLPLLTTLIAEQNFSIRVYQLAEPFQHRQQPDNDLQRLFQEIVDRTAVAFAADAVALRIFDNPTGGLPIVAKSGDIKDSLLVARKSGEHIAGRLLVDNDHDWAAITDHKGDAPTGMPIDPQDRESLRRAGVYSCLIMRLTSDVPGFDEVKQETRIGTLAYHMRRPHGFSWRDLALFRSYCQRVADAIALDRQAIELRKTNKELEDEQLLVVTQTSQAVSNELITMLGHDLFYKSFHACTSLQDYTKRVNKTLLLRGITDELLTQESDNAMQAAVEVQSTLQRLRAIQTSSSRSQLEQPSVFRLTEVLDGILSILSGPLSRNRITVKASIPEGLTLQGPKGVYTGVLFNLVINSIDAARSRSSTKPMSIHVHAKREGSGKKEVVVVQFWDEGPGINRKLFRNPQEIFKIGVTTKEYGTGMGLPVSRHLLNTHFHGNIELIDAERAMFRITVPVSAN